MIIQSKLQEVNKTLFKLNLGDEFNEAGELEFEKIADNNNWVDINCMVQYMDGLCLVETILNNHKPITDIYTIHDDYIQLSFLINGESHLLNKRGKEVEIDLGVVQVCYEKDKESVIKMPTNSKIHYFCIFMSRPYYLTLLGKELWTNKDDFFNKVSNLELISFGIKSFPMNFSIYRIVNDILSTELKGPHKKHYTQIKLVELFFTLHLLENSKTAFVNDLKPEIHRKIEKARAYLGLNFKSPPTIKDLSRKVLLNELQLKQGFKQVYGLNVYAYVIQLRMEEAKSLLGKQPVNEIAATLGYKSVSHFIATFKKFYGCTPKQALGGKLIGTKPGWPGKH